MVSHYIGLKGIRPGDVLELRFPMRLLKSVTRYVSPVIPRW